LPYLGESGKASTRVCPSVVTSCLYWNWLTRASIDMADWSTKA